MIFQWRLAKARDNTKKKVERTEFVVMSSEGLKVSGEIAAMKAWYRGRLLRIISKNKLWYRTNVSTVTEKLYQIKKWAVNKRYLWLIGINSDWNFYLQFRHFKFCKTPPLNIFNSNSQIPIAKITLLTQSSVRCTDYLLKKQHTSGLIKSNSKNMQIKMPKIKNFNVKNLLCGSSSHFPRFLRVKRITWNS